MSKEIVCEKKEVHCTSCGNFFEETPDHGDSYWYGKCEKCGRMARHYVTDRSGM